MRTLVFLTLFLFTGNVFGQKINYAHGLQLSVSFPKKLRFVVSYNFHLNSDLRINCATAVRPFLDVKISLFHNHLGSNVFKECRSFLYFNSSFSYGGLISAFDQPYESLLPVFTTNFSNSFNNSYKFNIGAGSTYMFQKGTKEGKFIHQKIGNIMFSLHDFYLTYYNDGGPVLKIFGDKEDRYWTGGIAAGVFMYRNMEKHQVELFFDKFTGFDKDAFEATGLIFIDKVAYKSLNQVGYNTGRWGLKYINHEKGLGVSANLWNLRYDLQDFLHKNATNNPYHAKTEDPYFDVELLKYYHR